MENEVGTAGNNLPETRDGYVFKVVERCPSHEDDHCILEAGHAGPHVKRFNPSNWCFAIHPSGVTCDLQKDHDGLHNHADKTVNVLFERWETFTQEDVTLWRARATLMNVKNLARHTSK